ncbi:MAG TPA: hypothetical protein VG328_03205 [Stellaceae bacterium]|jgi:hypothetical protein|nr:hypothetical protein [Stellaceae bacterium]
MKEKKRRSPPPFPRKNARLLRRRRGRCQSPAQIAKIAPRDSHAASRNKAPAAALLFLCWPRLRKVMPHVFGTAEHWLTRASEARQMAESITDPEAKRAMLEIAANYEKVAKRAEARDAGVPFRPNRENP